ncbi:MAG: leucine-rich repeat domain-containing protein [Clostridia bacterium]|jgi:hypothetical protein|nr:leucine-rich repeat domain-containing protein [Clostridia bacterium]
MIYKNSFVEMNFEIINKEIEITKITQCPDNLCLPDDLRSLPIVKICDHACENLKNLKNIILPEHTKTIGKYAFLGCSNLINTNFPSELISIEDSAFFECSNLKNALLNDGLVDIGNRAFFCCTNLQSLNIPASVRFIGKEAFAFCSSKLNEIKLKIGLPKDP